MEILVTGGRGYANQVKLERVLLGMLPITKIIQGGCNLIEIEEGVYFSKKKIGADYFAFMFAKKYKIPCSTVMAKWDEYGKKAGMLRNEEMLLKNKGATVVAFPGGTGTANCVSIARALKMKVIIIEE